MPDVLSLELGGGSTCIWDNATVRALALLYMFIHNVVYITARSQSFSDRFTFFTGMMCCEKITLYFPNDVSINVESNFKASQYTVNKHSNLQPLYVYMYMYCMCVHFK